MRCCSRRRRWRCCCYEMRHHSPSFISLDGLVLRFCSLKLEASLAKPSEVLVPSWCSTMLIHAPPRLFIERRLRHRPHVSTFMMRFPHPRSSSHVVSCPLWGYVNVSQCILPLLRHVRIPCASAPPRQTSACVRCEVLDSSLLLLCLLPCAYLCADMSCLAPCVL